MALIHYEIPDDVHRRAKAAAALQGVTLRSFICAALELATKAAEADQKRWRRSRRNLVHTTGDIAEGSRLPRA